MNSPESHDESYEDKVIRKRKAKLKLPEQVVLPNIDVHQPAGLASITPEQFAERLRRRRDLAHRIPEQRI